MKQQRIDMAKSKVKEQTENTSEQQTVDSELKNIIEAALYASKAPLGIKKIIALFPDDAQPSKVDIQNVILNLEAECEFRGVELKRIGNGWRFQSKEKYSTWLRKLSGNKAPRYSRALLETLSIIAYRQPVTRGDIEEIRGVGVSSETIRTLEDRGWISQIGHRDVPGRPALFGTTQEFLEYFNMGSLRELPELMDKRALGEIAKDLNMTLPMDGVDDQDKPDPKFEDNTQPEGEQGGNVHGAEVIELHPDDAVDTVDSSSEQQAEGSSAEKAEGSLEHQAEGSQKEGDDAESDER